MYKKQHNNVCATFTPTPTPFIFSAQGVQLVEFSLMISLMDDRVPIQCIVQASTGHQRGFYRLLSFVFEIIWSVKQAKPCRLLAQQGLVLVNSNSLINAFAFIQLLFEIVILVALSRDHLIKELFQLFHRLTPVYRLPLSGNKHDGQENLTLV